MLKEKELDAELFDGFVLGTEFDAKVFAGLLAKIFDDVGPAVAAVPNREFVGVEDKDDWFRFENKDGLGADALKRLGWDTDAGTELPAWTELEAPNIFDEDEFGSDDWLERALLGSGDPKNIFIWDFLDQNRNFGKLENRKIGK